MPLLFLLLGYIRSVCPSVLTVRPNVTAEKLRKRTVPEIEYKALFLNFFMYSSLCYNRTQITDILPKQSREILRTSPVRCSKQGLILSDKLR